MITPLVSWSLRPSFKTGCKSLVSFVSFVPLFMTSMAHFSMPNSIPMSWLYILTACMRVSNSFSFFANNSMSSCDQLSLYPAVHFLSIWFSGIKAIMNSKGDSASPWKSSLWIFCCQLHSPGLHGLFYEVYDFMWYFVHFEAVYYPAMRNRIICLLVINPGHS